MSFGDALGVCWEGTAGPGSCGRARPIYGVSGDGFRRQRCEELWWQPSTLYRHTEDLAVETQHQTAIAARPVPVIAVVSLCGSGVLVQWLDGTTGHYPRE